MLKNTKNHFRGLHVVLVNPLNGKIVFSKVFDTYTSSDLFEKFILELEKSQNSIVIAAC